MILFYSYFYIVSSTMWLQKKLKTKKENCYDIGDKQKGNISYIHKKKQVVQNILFQFFLVFRLYCEMRDSKVTFHDRSDKLTVTNANNKKTVHPVELEIKTGMWQSAIT